MVAMDIGALQALSDLCTSLLIMPTNVVNSSVTCSLFTMRSSGAQSVLCSFTNAVKQQMAGDNRSTYSTGMKGTLGACS